MQTKLYVILHHVGKVVQYG